MSIKQVSWKARNGSNGHIRWAQRHRGGLLGATVIVLSAGSIAAQVAGSVVSHVLPFPAGSSVIDSAQNVYSVMSSPLQGENTPVTPGAAQTHPGGGQCVLGGTAPPIPVACTDVYVGKSDSSGNLVFGTYLGGPQEDNPAALATDSSGDVFITGTTGGSFPTTSNAAIASTSAGSFAAKLSADASHFVYSTLLPVQLAIPVAIAVDAQGAAYIAGLDQGSHVCVVKLSADGSAVLYTALVGGSGNDMVNAIAVDNADNLVLTGSTNSKDFPVTDGAIESALDGAQNAFVTKLDSSGKIVFSTYLGGDGSDAGYAVAVDSGGSIFVAGIAGSSDFPTSTGAFQPVAAVPLSSNTPGGFVAKLTPQGSMAWSTYAVIGATRLSAVTLGQSGDVWLAGVGGAGFYVTASAPQPCYGGAPTDYVLHLDDNGGLVGATFGTPQSSTVLATMAADDSSVDLVALGGNNSALLSEIKFGSDGWASPCLSPDVVNAATFVSGGNISTGNIAPGELVTLTGLGIGPDTGVTYQPGPQGQAPMELGGVSVYFGGIPAPLLYVQSRQINAEVPFEVAGATTEVTLEYGGITFGPFQLTVAEGVPGIFRLQPGISTQAAANNQDGTINSATNPADPGSIVTVYGTGLGPTNPSCATGSLNLPVATGMYFPNLQINDMSGGPPVQYEGSSPGLLCGVVQINFQIPLGTPSGAFIVDPIFVQRSTVWATVAVK
jgi:uncharacterized protein (TIGR03437 family)